MTNYIIAATAAIEAARPRSSGPTVNVHVVRSPKIIQPDFEKMRQQIQGDFQQPEKEGVVVAE